MTKLHFRMATENDMDFIRQLSGKLFSTYGNYDEIVANWYLQPNVTTVVVTEETIDLGFAMLKLKGERGLRFSTGELLAIAVGPEYQRRGIGNALLGHMESLALQYGLGEIQLHTAQDNNPARSFFQKAWYKVISSGGSYYPRGQPALAMSKMFAP